MRRLEEFGRARDFWVTLFMASRSLVRSRLTLETIRAKEGVRAQSYAMIAHGGVSDKTAPIDDRMDYETIVNERDRDFRDLAALALDVLYGREGETGGISRVAGSATADAMALRFVDGNDWADVAEGVHYSVRSCQRMCEAGIDLCDALGWERVIRGEGRAI